MTIHTPPKRRRAARIATAISLAAAAALPLTWGIAAAASFISGDDGGMHRFHDLTGTGIVLAILWLGAVARLARGSDRHPAALLQLLSVPLTAAAATVLSGESPVVPVVVAVPALALLALHGDRAALRVIRPNAAVAALAVGAAVPLTLYAVGQGHTQSVSTDAHAQMEHYFDMAWIALLIPATTAVAALGVRGWRWAAGCAAAGAGLLGVAAMVFPDQASSPGAGWGVVAVVWALTLIAVTGLSEPAPEPVEATAF